MCSCKSRVFARFMSVVCLCSVAVFGLTSCQSAGQNQVNSQGTQATEKADSAQSDTVIDNQNKSESNQDSQSDIASNDNSDADNTNTVTDPQTDNSATSDEVDFEFGSQTEESVDEAPRPKPGLSSGSRLASRSSSEPNSQKLSPNDVKQSLAELNRTMQSACQPKKGNLKVSFSIQNSGKITKIETIGGSLKDSESEKCIIDQLSKYRFSKFKGNEVPAKYAFEF